MTKKEKELTAKLLDLVSNRLGYNICNDVPDEIFDGWTLEEKQELVKNYHDVNGDPEEYDENNTHLPDYALAWYLSNKLIKEIKDED